MAKKRKKQVQQKQLSEKQYIKQKARSLPIHKCYIMNGWQEGGVANIIVMRKHTNGNISGALFYIDLFSEGIKDTFFKFNESEDFFDEEIEERNFDEVSYDLVHNIIYGAMAYAEDNGLKNSKDFAITQYMLEEDTNDIPLIDIEFGQNGKPLLLIDQNKSNEHKIFALKKTLGEGNFNVVYFDEIDDYSEDDNLERHTLIEEETLRLIIEENYKKYGFLSYEEALIYAEEENLFEVFQFIREHNESISDEEAEKKFQKFPEISKIRLHELMYFFFSTNIKEFTAFIGICFFDSYPESKFDIEEELIGSDTENIKNNSELIKKLNRISLIPFNKEKKYKDLLKENPLSEPIIVALMNYYKNVDKIEEYLKFVKELFYENKENLFLTGAYFNAFASDKKELAKKYVKIENVKKTFPNQKMYKREDIFILYTTFITNALKNSNFQLAGKIYNAIAKLYNEDALFTLRKIIAVAKQDKIDKIQKK